MLGHSLRLGRFALLMVDVFCLLGVFVVCDQLSDVIRHPVYEALNLDRPHDPNPASMYRLR